MATPCHAYEHRVDNKMYRLQTTEKPIVRTEAQDTFCMDDYPNGCNAIVAVISYTGMWMPCMTVRSSNNGLHKGTIWKMRWLLTNLPTREGELTVGYWHTLAMQPPASLFRAIIRR